jgi:hypothetical protein
MTGVMKAMLGVAFVLVVVLIIMAVVVSPRPDSSFHPNGTTILSGAIVCPDSVGARSEFHKGVQGEKAMNRLVPSGDPAKDMKFLQAALEIMKIYKPDFSPYRCSELEAGVPVYIENEDATGIATIIAKLPDETLVHGITYVSEIHWKKNPGNR